MDYLFFAIIVGLLGYVFFKEKQNEKIIRDILAFKISKDASDFKNLVMRDKEEEKETVEAPEEIPLEEAPADKILEKLKG